MTQSGNRPRGGSDADPRQRPPAPSQSGSSGGATATEIGSRDEERTALGGDPQPTRATKADKVQPNMPKRADHEEAKKG